MVSERARRVVQPLSPRVVAPFEARVCPPQPADRRATNIIREKVAQRTRNVNDNKAGLQLRDAMRMFDTKKDGTISPEAFRKVIESYNPERTSRYQGGRTQGKMSLSLRLSI